MFKGTDFVEWDISREIAAFGKFARKSIVLRVFASARFAIHKTNKTRQNKCLDMPERQIKVIEAEWLTNRSLTSGDV